MRTFICIGESFVSTAGSVTQGQWRAPPPQISCRQRSRARPQVILPAWIWRRPWCTSLSPWWTWRSVTWSRRPALDNQPERGTRIRRTFRGDKQWERLSLDPFSMTGLLHTKRNFIDQFICCIFRYWLCPWCRGARPPRPCWRPASQSPSPCKLGDTRTPPVQYRTWGWARGRTPRLLLRTRDHRAAHPR